MKRKQLGLSLVGMITGSLLLALVALLGMKIVPPYLEFMSVKKVMSAMAADASVMSGTPKQIQDSFDRRASIDYITAVTGKDLDLAKGQGGRYTATAHYTVTVPLVGNLSALMEFDASTEGGS